MFQDTLVPRLSAFERGCLTLVAALLLFAGAAELITLDTGPERRAAGPHPVAAVVHHDRLTADRSLPPRMRGGRVLIRLADAGLISVERDATDSSLLHVVVPHGGAVVDCSLIGATVRVVRQDPRQVRLQVSGYEYVPAADARSGRGGTTCVTAGTASVPVRLSSPLGRRAIYSGHDARAVVITANGASVPWG